MPPPSHYILKIPLGSYFQWQNSGVVPCLTPTGSPIIHFKLVQCSALALTAIEMIWSYFLSHTSVALVNFLLRALQVMSRSRTDGKDNVVMRAILRKLPYMTNFLISSAVGPVVVCGNDFSLYQNVGECKTDMIFSTPSPLLCIRVCLLRVGFYVM